MSRVIILGATGTLGRHVPARRFMHAHLLRWMNDFAIDGVAAGDDLSARFKTKSQGVRELILAKPITTLSSGRLKVSVKDRQGNTSLVERTFSVTAP